jgi:hypothetical protein
MAEASMTERHQRQHEELLRLANTILTNVSDLQFVRCGDFTRKRLEFARALKTHCEEESITVQASVTRGDLSQEVVSRFARELAAWRADLVNSNGQWAPTNVLQDPEGFRRSFGPVVKALHDYIDREDREVLAAIGRRAA